MALICIVFAAFAFDSYVFLLDAAALAGFVVLLVAGVFASTEATPP